jgi:hypothetical protein
MLYFSTEWNIFGNMDDGLKKFFEKRSHELSEVLSFHFPGGIVENHENSQSKI